jgi:hypothetical protein
MTIGNAIHITVGCSAALAWTWMAWRTVRTGMPAGNAKMNPRREERPVQFWFLAAFYVGVAIWSAVQAFGPVRV